MQFPTPLAAASLRRRYKRFLADVTLDDGRELVVHCPNPGAMTGLTAPGTRAWLAPAAKSAKLPYGWKLAELPSGAFVMIDAGLANRVVAEALEAALRERSDAAFTSPKALVGDDVIIGALSGEQGAARDAGALIAPQPALQAASGCRPMTLDGLFGAAGLPGLPPFSGFRAEVALDGESRIDFRLDGARGPIWLEVKSVTLARGRRADFPDSRTLRGTRHLRALTKVTEAGGEAAMLYLLSRDDCDHIGIAGDIDPAYAAAFAEARAAGLRMIGLATRLSPEGIWTTKAVPVL